MQASLGGIAALVYYSRGAKLVTAVGYFDDLPDRIHIQAQTQFILIKWKIPLAADH